MDKYRIDSHKLMYHPEKVALWRLSGDIDAPIYMEVSPSGVCNHRCIMCALDFMGYKKEFISHAGLIDFLKDASSAGLKSVMFAGEGEPFLHPFFAKIVQDASTFIDVSITTNGVFFNDPEAIIPYCKWIKVSINSGNAQNYAKPLPKTKHRLGVHAPDNSNTRLDIHYFFALYSLMVNK